MRYSLASGIDSAKIAVEEDTMSEREQRAGTDSGASDAGDEPRQPPRLSPEEIEQLAAYEEFEEFMEEPPEGNLSVISDEDVPGAPG